MDAHITCRARGLCGKCDKRPLCWASGGTILGLAVMWAACGVAAAQTDNFTSGRSNDLTGVFVSIPMALGGLAVAIACALKVGRELASVSTRLDNVAADLDEMKIERRADREELRDDIAARHEDNVQRFTRIEERLDIKPDN